MELFTRTVSAFPVSIGTSLSLESIFTGPNPTYDSTRKPPPRINLSNYDSIYINVELLIRNISASVDRIRYLDSPANHVLEILLTEMDIINSVFQQEGNNICKVVYYICSYRDLKLQKLGKVDLRESNTVISKSYDLKADTVLKKLNKKTDVILNLDSEIKGDRRSSALIMTHYPVDLLSSKNFRRMDLLESNTGLLKPKELWNSKYYPLSQNSMNHLPFCKELLFIFGDRNLISPQSIKTRQRVYDISIKNKWTIYTTVQKIHQSYRDANLHPADLQILLSF